MKGSVCQDHLRVRALWYYEESCDYPQKCTTSARAQLGDKNNENLFRLASQVSFVYVYRSEDIMTFFTSLMLFAQPGYLAKCGRRNEKDYFRKGIWPILLEVLKMKFSDWWSLVAIILLWEGCFHYLRGFCDDIAKMELNVHWRVQFAIKVRTISSLFECAPLELKSLRKKNLFPLKIENKKIRAKQTKLRYKSSCPQNTSLEGTKPLEKILKNFLILEKTTKISIAGQKQ